MKIVNVGLRLILSAERSTLQSMHASRAISSALVVEPPNSAGLAANVLARHGGETGAGEIDGSALAAHALVDDSRHGGAAIGELDGNLPVAEWVTVGLGTHQSDRQRNHGLGGSIHTRESTGPDAQGVVECGISLARASRGALAIRRPG